MTTPEIIAMIANRQQEIASLQAILTAREVGSNDFVTLQFTARKGHIDQTPQDDAHAAEWALWNAEEAAHTDPTELWVQPEHAYWLRLAKNAILAGAIDPITG